MNTDDSAKDKAASPPPATELAIPPPPAIPSLKEKQLTFIADWNQWLTLWEETTRAEDLLGLLHAGFNVSGGKDEKLGDRVIFFLHIADGFGSPSSFGRESEHGRMDTSLGRKNVPEIKAALARKALAMLCQHFFGLKKRHELDNHPQWAHLVATQEIMDAVLAFFRPESWGHISNLGSFDSERQAEVVRDFLHDFCRFFWEFNFFGERWSKSDELILTRLKENRHRLIPLMERLSMLSLFLSRRGTGIGRSAYAMDEKSLRVLRNSVMSQPIQFPADCGGENRRPKTLAEALLGETSAAVVLYTVLGIQQERTRLIHIQELREKSKALEKKSDEAKKKIKTLVGS